MGALTLTSSGIASGGWVREVSILDGMIGKLSQTRTSLTKDLASDFPFANSEIFLRLWQALSLFLSKNNSAYLSKGFDVAKAAANAPNFAFVDWRSGYGGARSDSFSVEASPFNSAALIFAQQESAMAIAELARRWKKSLLDVTASKTSKALGETIDPLFEAMLQFGASAIDLRNLPVERVNGIHLAVILRATLTRKEETPGWEEALEVAKQALQREGIDIEDALGGLLP